MPYAIGNASTYGFLVFLRVDSIFFRLLIICFSTALGRKWRRIVEELFSLIRILSRSAIRFLVYFPIFMVLFLGFNRFVVKSPFLIIFLFLLGLSSCLVQDFMAIV